MPRKVVETVQFSIAEMRARALSVPDAQWSQISLEGSKSDFLRWCDYMEFEQRRPFVVMSKEQYEALLRGIGDKGE